MTTYESWFVGTKVTFDPDLEGNEVRDGRMVLGLRAGPEKGDPLNLFHEMGHLIEIDDERCTMVGWGLDVPMLSIPGFQPCTNCQTFQAPAREVRVIGIQRTLALYFGISFEGYEGGKLIYAWVPGADYITQEYPELPCYTDYEDGDPDKPSYDEMCKMRHARLDRAIVEASEQWPIERVRAEWDRKMKIHEARMP